VQEVAVVMGKQRKAAVVMEGEVAVGIFTPKDLLFRVVAKGYNPSLIHVGDVMTAEPDTVGSQMTILDALHQMHDGRYLHLPVVGETGALIGLVDVLELTYGVMTRAGRDFWSSSLEQVDDDTASVMSAKRSVASTTVSPSRNEIGVAQRINPDESLRSETSVTGASAGSFLFKVKDDRGNMHRLQSSASKFDALTLAVSAKLLNKSEFLLKYKDDEGDEVTLSSDESLAEAVSMAIEAGWKVLHITVSDIAAVESGHGEPGAAGRHGDDMVCVPFTDQRVTTAQAALGAATVGGVLLIGLIVVAMSRRSR
jgi:CBS domain-containing protein